MPDKIDRRTFLHRAAHSAAAGALIGNLDIQAAETQPSTRPALEWRNKQPTMGYARLGRTRFMASRCVFGAGGLYRRSRDQQLLEFAIERGLNTIDTARSYGNSEGVLSDLAKRHRDRIWINSKAPHIGWPDMTVKRGEDAKAAKLYTGQLEESLRQLKIDCIDCYMIQGAEHDWIVTMDALYEAFTKARQAGKVRYFGLATHTNVRRVCELAAQTGRYDVVLLAVNPNSVAELSPAIKKMHDAGIGVVSMKTSGPIRANPKVYDRGYGATFGRQTLSPYQRAYAYLLSRGGVDAFLSHMPTRRILEENLAVPTLRLEQTQLDRLQQRVLADARGACRHCGNCNRACPEGIRPGDMLRQHAYVHAYHEREVARDWYETLGRDRALRCKGCGECRAACPESIDLPGVIASLRADFA